MILLHQIYAFLAGLPWPKHRKPRIAEEPTGTTLSTSDSPSVTTFQRLLSPDGARGTRLAPSFVYSPEGTSIRITTDLNLSVRTAAGCSACYAHAQIWPRSSTLQLEPISSSLWGVAFLPFLLPIGGRLCSLQDLG